MLHTFKTIGPAVAAITGTSTAGGILVSIVDSIPAGVLVGAAIGLVGLVVKTAVWQQKVDDTLTSINSFIERDQKEKEALWQAVGTVNPRIGVKPRK